MQHLLEIDVVFQRDWLLVNTHSQLVSADLDSLGSLCKILSEALRVPYVHTFGVNALLLSGGEEAAGWLAEEERRTILHQLSKHFYIIIIIIMHNTAKIMLLRPCQARRLFLNATAFPLRHVTTKSATQAKEESPSEAEQMVAIFAADSTYTLVKKLLIYRMMSSNLFINHALTGMNMSYKVLGRTITNMIINKTAGDVFTSGETLQSLAEDI